MALVLEIWNYFFIVKKQYIKCNRQEGNLQITESFMQLILQPGPCWAVSSGFQGLSNLLPQLALCCPGLGGADRGGQWGWE